MNKEGLTVKITRWNQFFGELRIDVAANQSGRELK
jgi:hypothetical protein